MNGLRIAQVAPLYESVPPRLYGGTERVVSYLTEALVEQGHTVTLFASGDSVTSAKLVPVCEEALRLNTTCVDQLAHHIILMQMVQNRLEDFDIVHYHIDYLHFPFSKTSFTPHVTTLHGRLNIPDLKALYRVYDDIPVISISNSQRQPLEWLNWITTIYHGLPENLHTPCFDEGEYLLFLGRISAEKRLDRAIDIAVRTGTPLKVAAKVDRSDQEYFDTNIRHLLDHPLVEFLGEVGEHGKGNLLRGAKALIFPIDWEEPFGLVMIEALACGTPVVAYGNGSVPEILEHGRTGFIVSNQEEAIGAVQDIGYISRRECRLAFEERFTSTRMAREYVDAYQLVMHLQGNRTNLKIV